MNPNKKVYPAPFEKSKRCRVYRKSGIVSEALPSANFRVRLDEGKEIIAHISGKLRIYRIKVLPGDRVTVEMSPYDEARGRIVYRGK